MQWGISDIEEGIVDVQQGISDAEEGIFDAQQGIAGGGASGYRGGLFRHTRQSSFRRMLSTRAKPQNTASRKRTMASPG